MNSINNTLKGFVEQVKAMQANGHNELRLGRKHAQDISYAITETYVQINELQSKVIELQDRLLKEQVIELDVDAGTFGD